MRFFYLAGYAQNAGTGIERMQSLMEWAGLRLQMDEQPQAFTVFLSRHTSNKKNVAKIQKVERESDPLEVFCCYAREDQEMFAQLKKHLAPLRRQSQITLWSDTNLNAGEEWKKELHQHLESADIILLLISPDFMDSDYCYSTDLGRAIERHNQGEARVIPILLRPAFWQNAPFAQLQTVPTNARHVTSWPDRDEAFYNIILHINQVVSELRTRRAQIQVYGYYGDQHRRVARQSETAQGAFLVPFFDPAKLMVLRTLTGHKGTIEYMVFSPDGSLLASGSNDHTIKLWEVSSGREQRTLTGHKSRVGSVVFGPDGSLLASGSNDHTIKLWEVPSGRELRTLTGHMNSVGSVAFGSDSSLLASCSDYPTIKFWEGSSWWHRRTLNARKKSRENAAFN